MYTDFNLKNKKLYIKKGAIFSSFSLLHGMDEGINLLLVVFQILLQDPVIPKLSL